MFCAPGPREIKVKSERYFLVSGQTLRTVGCGRMIAADSTEEIRAWPCDHYEPAVIQTLLFSVKCWHCINECLPCGPVLITAYTLYTAESEEPGFLMPFLRLSNFTHCTPHPKAMFL